MHHEKEKSLINATLALKEMAQVSPQLAVQRRVKIAVLEISG